MWAGAKLGLSPEAGNRRDAFPDPLLTIFEAPERPSFPTRGEIVKADAAAAGTGRLTGETGRLTGNPVTATGTTGRLTGKTGYAGGSALDKGSDAVRASARIERTDGIEARGKGGDGQGTRRARRHDRTARRVGEKE